jgi:hypothetical protein
MVTKYPCLHDIPVITGKFLVINLGGVAMATLVHCLQIKKFSKYLLAIALNYTAESPRQEKYHQCCQLLARFLISHINLHKIIAEEKKL